MAMKHHGIEMVGPFINQKVSGTPTWTTSDEGRIIYDSSGKKMYYGNNTEWKEPTSATITTPIPLYESNGDILWDDLSNISLWTDGDTNSGISTSSLFGGKQCIQFTSSAAGSNNRAIRSRSMSPSGFPDKITFTMKYYAKVGGGQNTSDGDYINVNFGTNHSNAQLNFYMFDAAGDHATDPGPGIGLWESTGSEIIPITQQLLLTGEWMTITLDINFITQLYDLYFNGILVCKNRYFSNSNTLSDGVVYISSAAESTLTNRYVDYVKVGTALTQINSTEDYGINQDYGSLVWGTGSTGTGGAGYAAGGYTSSGNLTTTIDKLTFSNDNCNSIISGLSTTLASLYAGYNSYTSGYTVGGDNGSGYVSTINKLTFSNDNNNSITSHLSASGGNGGSFESSVAGYAVGGTLSSVVNRLTFSNDINISISSTVSTHNYNYGMSSSENGYSLGGEAGSTVYSNIDKLSFSDESVNTISSTLSTNRSRGTAVNSSSNGYTCGGSSSSGGTYESRIDKLTFSNDNCASISTTLSNPSNNPAGFNSTSSGYISGGRTTGGIYVSTIDKLNFTSDAISTITSTLSRNRSHFSAFNTL